MINHSIDDEGTLTIYDGNKSICEISECKGLDQNQVEALITEVLADLNYHESEDE